MCKYSICANHLGTLDVWIAKLAPSSQKYVGIRSVLENVTFQCPCIGQLRCLYPLWHSLVCFQILRAFLKTAAESIPFFSSQSRRAFLKIAAKSVMFAGCRVSLPSLIACPLAFWRRLSASLWICCRPWPVWSAPPLSCSRLQALSLWSAQAHWSWCLTGCTALIFDTACCTDFLLSFCTPESAIFLRIGSLKTGSHIGRCYKIFRPGRICFCINSANDWQRKAVFLCSNG